MKHWHKASGLTFECGELMDFPTDGVRKTFDMTVITLWDDKNESDPHPPVIAGYYFGDYDEATTDYYIDRWLKTARECKDIVDAYWITNEDVLVDDEYSDYRSKTQRVRAELNRVLEVFDNE